MTKSAGICELKENDVNWQAVVTVSANAESNNAEFY